MALEDFSNLSGIFANLGNVFNRARGNTATPTPTPTPAATTPAVSPQNQAFQAFYDTPLYQVPLQEGLDAVNASWAGRGSLQSGAAMKAISDYGAGHASGALSDYFGLLGQQQNIGYGAASAQAGIGQGYGSQMANAGMNYAQGQNALSQNYTNNITNLSGNLANAQGQYAQNAGNIYSNQATANANNTNGLISGIGNAFGNVAGYYAYR